MRLGRNKAILVGAQGCESCQEQGTQELEPVEAQIEIVADGGEHDVDGNACCMGEVVSAHAVDAFGMVNMRKTANMAKVVTVAMEPFESARQPGQL